MKVGAYSFCVGVPILFLCRHVPLRLKCKPLRLGQVVLASFCVTVHLCLRKIALINPFVSLSSAGKFYLHIRSS